MTEAVVRVWHAEDGWGVVDSEDTPGGCWTHFSAVAVPGYRSLEVGQAVQLEWERATHDGFEFHAVGVWPRGLDPVHPIPSDGASMRSTLTITFDAPEEDAAERRPGPAGC